MISCFDLVAILSCLAGLYILISRNTFLFSRDTKLLMITMLLISTGYSFFMLIEWMNISHKFEAYENLLGALLPMNWAFIYYSFIQHNKKEELHNHQEKLKMSEERLNLSLKGTKAGIWDWHIQTGNLVINDQWAEMIGYKPSELQPVDIHTWEKLSHPDDLKKSNEMLDLHFKGKTDFYECEARLRHKNGNWVWVLDRGMVVERDGQGCPVRMTGTHIDISKQKNTESDLKEQMEENRALSEEYLSQNEELIKSLERIRKINEELEEARKKAEESDHLKSAFLANMSHEIRTPMNGIIGFSEMIMDPTLSTEKRNYYARIVIESSRQLETIVNDILDIARIESGNMVLLNEEVNISRLMDDLLAFFEPQALSKHILIQTDKPPDHRQTRIVTDKTRLRQVLTNLLNNALKFTDAGYIRFGYEKSGRYLQFFVKDSGIGIPPELHEKIFEPFRQAEIEISSQYGGTGLGLSISAKLVGMLGGKIWLKSAPGMGSTFYFTVPLQAQEFTETIKEEPPRIADLDGLELTILVAEDDDVNYLYLSTILSKGKIKMVRARNGVEALELCKTKPDIQLVLLDIKMPVMSGYEAAKKIKQIRTDLPIIAQTAFAMNEDRRKALASGCDAYLSKPIKKEELLGFIDKLARKNQAEA